MSISEISIRRPIMAWMAMSALIVFGGISFYKMGISQLPDVDFPVVSINIRLEGAAPEVIETEIVDFVEDAVMGIQGVRNVTSRSENSEGTITVEFDLNRNIDLAVQDVQAKLSQIQSKLPREITATTISKTNPEDQPIMLLTLESNKYPLRDLMYFVSDRIKDQFSMVSGVGDITLGGYVDPNLRVWVSPQKLNSWQLTVADVINTIQSEHSEMPAGEITNLGGDKMFYVRTMGEATSVDQFGKIILNSRGAQPIYQNIHLDQVANVEEGTADVLRYTRANGVPGVGLGILKQRGSNAVEVAKGIRAKIEEVRNTLPAGMDLKVNFDSTRYVEQAVGELNFTLILSALLTAIVCWIFLGSLSSTLNVLFSIPTSVVGTFIFLYFSGFTLNTFTLLGLSLSIGIVVDDAIMVLENIIRHQERGEDRVQASILGSKEITFAAIAATFSIIAIFLPVVFMKGIVGKFFFQFGVTMTVAVFLSLIEALTLTPMRCSQFVGVHERTTRLGRFFELIIESLTKLYKRTLPVVLHHPMITLTLTMSLCLTSYMSLGYLNKEFLPSEDQSRFNIRLKTPIGSSLEFSNQKFKEVENFLSIRSEVDRYVMQVGGGSPGDANNGSVLVTMKEKGLRGVDKTVGHELSQKEFMDLCRNQFKKIDHLRAGIQDLSTKGFTASRGFPVEFTVEGPDWDLLAKYTKEIVAALDKSGLVTDLDTNYDSAMPEYQVIPDRAAEAEHAVSIVNISNTVNAAIGGVLVGRYPKNGHRYDVRVKLEDVKVDPIERMKGLLVRNNHGELVPLVKLVKIEPKSSMLEINRLNRERAITVYANVKSGNSQHAVLSTVQELSKSILPPQYHAVLSGSSQTFSESFHSLIFALLLGLLVAYMILASQFDSLLDPLIVLLALPFSVSGALVALLIAHQSINIYSMIGLILLMGIVKKNSILLVDFSNHIKKQENLEAKAALLRACPVRFRPILMTSVATIAGAIPSAISLGPGAESRVPMAVGIIGGVFVSTLLTLYVVPSAYLLVSTMRRNRSGPDEADRLEERKPLVVTPV